jgi:hypothetical protein
VSPESEDADRRRLERIVADGQQLLEQIERDERLARRARLGMASEAEIEEALK